MSKTKKLKYRSKNKRPPHMSYKLYMGSAYWKRRKQVYFSQHRKSCAVCGQRDGVTLHHNRYDVTYGDEPDGALTPLCREHHHQFHEHHKLAGNMSVKTSKYVDTMKQLNESNINDLSWII